MEVNAEGGLVYLACRWSAAAAIVGGGLLLLFGKWRWCTGLTLAATVAIINLRWLEGLVDQALEAGGLKLGFRGFAKAALRFALLVASVWAGLGFHIANPVAMIVGFSVPLVFLLVLGVSGAS